MTEIELKLAISPEDVAAFRRAAPLQGVRPTRRTLTSIYYDTPECTLAEAGMALRLRKSGGRWLQTLKEGRSATGGLHARGEWEHARPDASIDLSQIEGAPPETMTSLQQVRSRLEPAFTVKFQRETWNVEPSPGTRFEVALDLGEAQAQGKTDPVCEVEIELLEGESAAAFDFARSLLEAAPLRPSQVTKAQRGYRLFRGEALAPAKATRVELDPAMSPVEAARAIVGACLDQVQANEEGILATGDPEFVHQARVGLRRMRSALRIFREVLPAKAGERWRSELAEVARALGEARDWDVFATETLPPLAKAFGDPPLTRSLVARVAARRRRAREAARRQLRSIGYAHLILDLSRWLAGTAPAGPGTASGVPLVEFASRLIRRRHKRLVDDARDLALRSPQERHRIRIDAKRLRYCVEGFASLFRKSRVEKYSRELSALQDVLGRANDAATAERLLEDLAPPEDFEAYARGWLAARASGDIELVAVDVARLEGAKRFWRRKPAADAAREAAGA